MIRLDRVSARAGRFWLRDVSCVVERGAYGVLIGPAGAGKTTLLEVIAGIVPVAQGTINLRGEDATHATPESRRIGIVYQHAYLFPHLSAGENVGYGTTDRAAVDEMTERFALGALLGRGVHALSGGERQLVALARALATRPDILLLDEPFAALDPRTRVAVRRQVRALHAERGMTVLHVTHDFAEAGRLGNVVVLLEAGRVLQSGAPDDVFRRPASAAVADFVGAENVVRGAVRAIGTAAGPDRVVEFTSGPIVLHAVSDIPDGQAHAVIRADDISVAPETRASSVRNQLEARVIDVTPAGALTRVTVNASGVELVATITSQSTDELRLAPGSHVVVAIKATAVHLC